MVKFLKRTLFALVTFILCSPAIGQVKDSTDWNLLLKFSNFTEINSARKIDRIILKKFPSWKRMSKPHGNFNPTDVGKGRRLRLLFSAKIDNYWIVSYEHGGRGYHTHCLFITIDSNSVLTIKETDMKFDSLEYLKEFVQTRQLLLRHWPGYES